MAPIFGSFQAEEYLCDVWFVCGGVRVAAHRLVLAQLSPLLPNSLLNEILSSDSQESFVTLAGWEPRKVARMVSHLYTSGMLFSVVEIINSL